MITLDFLFLFGGVASLTTLSVLCVCLCMEWNQDKKKSGPRSMINLGFRISEFIESRYDLVSHSDLDPILIIDLDPDFNLFFLL